MRAILAAVVMMACGNPLVPAVGSACNTTNREAKCDGADKVLYCESNTWHEYASPGGCDGGVADFAGAMAGSVCPEWKRGTGTCGPDAGSIVICNADAGAWSFYADCLYGRTCSIEQGLVDCR